MRYNKIYTCIKKLRIQNLNSHTICTNKYKKSKKKSKYWITSYIGSYKVQPEN